MRDHSPLKSFSPVVSQAFPIMAKVYAEIAPKMVQSAMDGIHPVPLAFPAANVSIPAPATLFTRLNMEDAIVAPVAAPSMSPPREESDDKKEEEERLGTRTLRFSLLVLVNVVGGGVSVRWGWSAMLGGGGLRPFEVVGD